MSKTTENAPFRTSIGGQALMEGILMRGPKKQAIVCRLESGEMVETVEDLHPIREKYPILGLPILRGVVALFSSLSNGMKALSYSVSLLPEEQQEEPSKLDLWIEKHFTGETAQKLMMATAMIMGVGLSLLLFLFLPTFIAGIIPGLRDSFYARTTLEGILKLAIFLIYMILCARVPEIGRVFMYHGAEHKTIFCYENRQELTVDNVRVQPRLHPRCGTSFMVVVLIISIIAGSFIHTSNMWARMGLKLLILPLIIGVTYELNRWVGGHDDLLIARMLAWPGKQVQRITTSEPDDGMMECAIRAMELVIPEEEGADAW